MMESSVRRVLGAGIEVLRGELEVVGLGLEELGDCPWKEVDVPRMEGGCTPLITACQRGLTEAQTDLADVNTQNRDGRTPLMLAVRDVDLFEELDVRLPWEYRPVEVVRELLALSADLGVCDVNGCSALHYAAQIESPLKDELIHMMVESLRQPAPTPLDLQCFHPDELRVNSPSPSPSLTDELRATKSPSSSPSLTDELRATNSPSPSPSLTDELRATNSPSPSPSLTDELRATNSPSPSPSLTDKLRATNSPSPSPPLTDELRATNSPSSSPYLTQNVLIQTAAGTEDLLESPECVPLSDHHKTINQG
ncbi:uncharacterized protein LOC135519575 [Oncorhynchus masou masou]|uniref:uncharacterized protein LOC135519575 n=1 Tax=Oncorhynchus masou masou TaxID=90313 RepID=UPI003182EF73